MTKALPLPSQERLKELIEYNPVTGVCKRIIDSGNRKAGDKIGCLQKQKGYLTGSIDGQNYQVHRLIWMYWYGVDPGSKQVDNKNKIRSDNWIENLRLGTNQQNLYNMSASGEVPYKGVTLCKRTGLYIARILPSGKNISLGRYKTAEEASEAYMKAAKQFYGEYACST